MHPFRSLDESGAGQLRDTLWVLAVAAGWTGAFLALVLVADLWAG